jgi:6-phosphogluconolactonase
MSLFVRHSSLVVRRQFQGRKEMSEIVVCQDKTAVSRDAAYRVTALAAQSRVADRPFTIALAGGSTPAQLYALLAAPPFRDAIVWPNIQIFFGDERCVPPDSPDSNYRMARETLLDHVPLSDANIHRMRSEHPDPEQAARDYEAELRRNLPTSPNGLPRFDLILLGMGADGHCASLFPGKPALHEQERLVVAAEPGLKPFVPRLTLTFPVLNNAANVLFLVSGSDKAETLSRVLEGPPDLDSLPSQAVHPTDGTLTWLLDRDAARLVLNANQRLW